jgi:thiosulfate/3-mercaptopyruvate sulfurtransferase
MPLLSAPDLRSRMGSICLLDARQSASGYGAGHLPGAIHADLNRHLSTVSDPGHDHARGGRHPLPPIDRFTAQVGAWGIDADTEVVVYDASGGGNAAARLWWMLRALGHGRVRLLDGGLPAALAEGLALTDKVPSADPAPPYPADRWRLPIASVEAVERIRRDPTLRLLDVRSAERWRGEREPFDPVAGHIPGSLNLAWNDNLDPNGRFKSPDALRTQFQPLLADIPAGRLTVHCGSGVTACHTLVALEVAGLTGAALYVGGWSEWCRSGREMSPSLKPRP